MERRRLGAWVIGMLLVAAPPAAATHDAADHSPNAHLMSSTKLGGLSDMAFSGERAVVGQFRFDDGSTDGFSVLDLSEPDRPRVIRRFVCTGAGWDVSMWGDLVFLSTDQFTQSLDGTCASAPGSGFAGVKIVSIADPLNPVQVGSVPMPCAGSHNHTPVHDPANDRVILYAASTGFPEDAPGSPDCDAVIAVPLGAPENAEVIGTLPLDAVESCHDFAVHVERKLLAGGCLSELRLFDISDPAAPRLLSTFVNPAVAFQHSVAFSVDGDVLVSGEETVQSTGLMGGCTGGTPSPHGALWFHDISDSTVIKLRGHHQVGRGLEPTSPGGAGCSVHNFAAVPTRDGRDLLTVGWYSAGMSVVDFSDPGAPAEVAHYLPAERVHYWGAYWYRDHVYASNTFETEQGALDVFRVDGLGPAFRVPRMNPQTQEPPADAPAVDTPATPAAPAAAPAPSSKPAASCRPSPRRLRAPGRITGARVNGRRLRPRGRRVTVPKLAAGTYLVRIRYRIRRDRTRTLTRRVRFC